MFSEDMNLTTWNYWIYNDVACGETLKLRIMRQVLSKYDSKLLVRIKNLKINSKQINIASYKEKAKV